MSAVGRWVGSNVLDPSYLPPRPGGIDREDPIKPRLLKTLKTQQDLHSLLGAPVLFDTTILVLPGGGWTGECYFEGKKVSWSIWAPHKRLVVDIFSKHLPPQEELKHKDAFCTQHSIRYLVVPPEHEFGLDDLKEALDKEAA